MNYKILLTLLFVSVGLCGMDRPKNPRFTDDATKYPKDTAAQALALLSAAHSEHTPDQNAVPTITPQSSKQEAVLKRYNPIVFEEAKKQKLNPECAITCPECTQNFCDTGEMRDHILGEHASYERYTCSISGCAYKTASRNRIKSHLKDEHQQEDPIIPSASLANQKEIATKLNPFLRKLGWDAACDECDLLFPSTKAVLPHKKIHKKAPSANKSTKKITPPLDHLPSTPAAAQRTSAITEKKASESQETLPDCPVPETDIDQEMIAWLIEDCPFCDQPTLTDSSQGAPSSFDRPAEPNLDDIIAGQHKSHAPHTQIGLSRNDGQAVWTISSAPKSVFSCPEPGCSYLDQSPLKFKEHILKKHIPFAPYFCAVPECTFKPTNILNVLNTHIRYAHRSNNNFIASAQTSKKITHHLNEVLKKLGWEHTCKTCEELFPTQISLQNHTNKGHKRRGDA